MIIHIGVLLVLVGLMIGSAIVPVPGATVVLGVITGVYLMSLSSGC